MRKMAEFDPQKHHRRSIRLQGYDYGSPGAYFVTICTQGRECVLNDPVVSGIIQDVWCALPRWFPTIELDEFVIMPNHVHFVIWIHPHGEVGNVGAALAVAPDAVAPDAVAPAEWIIPDPQRVNLNPTLGDVVGAFKSLVFKVYLDWIHSHDPARRARFWQRNYYEHVIRNERELEAIRDYVRQNPDNWHADRDNPDNVRRLAPPIEVAEYVREATEGHTSKQHRHQER